MSFFDKKNGNGAGAAEPRPENGEPVKLMTIPLLIQMNPQTREVMLEGPLADKALCYEMMALAMKGIVEYVPPRSNKILEHVDPLMMPSLKGKPS